MSCVALVGMSFVATSMDVPECTVAKDPGVPNPAYIDSKTTCTSPT